MNTSLNPAGASGAGIWRLIPAVLALAVTVWFWQFIGPVADGDYPELVIPWVPALGIDLAFRLDGLSLAFALLISGIGALVFLYAATYFQTDRRLASLLITLIAFAVSMLGLTIADDAITLFVFWEGTTVTSYLLVGFDHENRTARRAALQALLVTGFGGVALLAGLLIMGDIAGTFRLSEMNQAGDIFRTSNLYPVIFAMVMLGCFTKSAQWPFQFWLPGAMAAPTPVSAYLHSATMVKAGVYLIARMAPSLGGTDLWIWTLMPVGAFTMLLASVWAMRQTDLKLMLAHTTVMGLSMMVMLLGASTEMAAAAAMTFLLVHAFYKAALFLSVGMIEKGSGSRDYTRIAGLGRLMPLTASVVGLAALSMAGFPPMFGFIGKEVIYKSTEYAPAVPEIIAAVALAANAMMVACSGMIALRPFFGAKEPKAPKPEPADPPWGLWLGPVVLAGLGLFCGLFPHPIEQYLIGPMVRSVTGGEMPIHLELWHGVNKALILSLITFAVGGLIYMLLDPIHNFLARIEPSLPETEAWYRGFLSGTGALARKVSMSFQDGNMTSYLRRTFVVLALLIWGGLLAGSFSWPEMVLSLRLLDWVIAGMIIVSVVVVLRTPSRLTAITALGGVGSGIGILFVIYGAADVAMTQLFVEILVVIFMATAMARLPNFGAIPFVPLNAVVAVFLGTAVTLTMIMVLGTDLDLQLTQFFEEKSYPEALGRNIVNVILVDFRGFDTMGETAVILFAGVAAYAVLMAGRGVRR